MRKLQYTIMLIAMLLSTKNIKAQIYVTDPSYVKDTLLSDDFSGTTLKSWKWYMQTDDTPGKGLEMMYHHNVIIQGDTLSIRADTLVPGHYEVHNGKTYTYESGTIISNNPSFKYGYIEMRARYPTGHTKFWPALWLERDTCMAGTPSASWYEEIDICENADVDSRVGDRAASNWHIYDAVISHCPSDPGLFGTDNYNSIYVSTYLQAAFHKYGFLWDSKGMSFYFDDNLIRTVKDTSINPTPKHALNAIIDFYITPWGYIDPIIWKGPHYFTIDYFYYYKQNADCSTNKTICNPNTDYYSATPARATEKTIIAGGASCTPTFNTSDQCTLKATDYVILDAGTTVNLNGSGYFTVLISSCPY